MGKAVDFRLLKFSSKACELLLVLLGCRWIDMSRSVRLLQLTVTDVRGIGFYIALFFPIILLLVIGFSTILVNVIRKDMTGARAELKQFPREALCCCVRYQIGHTPL